MSWNELFDEYENGKREPLVDAIRIGFFINDKGESVNDEALLMAVERGLEDIARMLIAKGSKIDSRNERGMTPLLMACERGLSRVFDLLIHNGADLNMNESNAHNCLMLACEYGHLDIVKRLLDQNVEIDKQSQTYLGEPLSPLVVACKNGHRELVELLLSKGAVENLTAFNEACLNGFKQLAELMFKKNAKIMASCRLDYLIFEASKRGHTEILQFLIEKGKQLYNAPERCGNLPFYCEPTNTQLVYFLVTEDVETMNDRIRQPIREIIGLVQRNHLNIYYIVRNILLKHVYTFFVHANKQTFQLVFEKAIEKMTPFLIKPIHMHVLRAINSKENATSYQQLQSEGVLSYFTSEEFRGKLRSELIGYLNENKELLKLGREKLVRLFPKFLCINPLNLPSRFKDQIKFTELIELIAKNRLINEINAENNNELREDKCVMYLRCIYFYNIFVNVQLDQAKEVLKLFSDEKLLEFCQSVNHKPEAIIEKQPIGKSALLIACESDENLALLKFLLKQNIDTEVTDYEGQTGLFIALWRGNFEIAKVLIENGAKFDSITNRHGENALFFCFSDRNLSFSDDNESKIKSISEVLKLLIVKGAQVDRKAKNGKTPLIKACDYDQFELVKLFVENGADIYLEDEQEKSALLIALTNREYRIFNFLINAIKTRGGFMPDKIARKLFIKIFEVNLGYMIEVLNLKVENIEWNESNEDQMTLFKLACDKGDFQILECLISKGFDLNSKNEKEEHVLFHTCDSNPKTNSDQGIKVEVIRFLVEKGVDLNVINRNGENCLFKAAISGQVDLVKVLIQNGIDVYLRNKNGNLIQLLSDEIRPYSSLFEIVNKEIIKILRKRLVESLCEFLKNSNTEAIRQMITESIEEQSDENSFLLNLDHIEAFESVIKDIKEEKEDVLQEVRESETWKYFQSFEFKEKFIEDVINHLKDYKELLEIAKLKLEENYSQIKTKKELIGLPLNSTIRISYSQLRDWLIKNEINHLISSAHTPETENQAYELWLSTVNFLEKVERNFNLANYFWNLIERNM
jgi:ankyrin repeat protein